MEKHQTASLISLSILLADNHTLFRAGMRHLLSKLPRQSSIIEAASGSEAIAKLRENQFDLVMMDLSMPDMMEVPFLMAVCAEAKEAPVVIVSACEQVEHIRLAIETGAAGFVPKSSMPEVMIQAIMLVLSGGIYLPPTLLDSLRYKDNASDSFQSGQRIASLSARQYAVLQYLASGWSNKQIARSLSVSEGTVKSHVSGLLKVLNAKNRTHAIVIATHQGILSNNDEPYLPSTPL